MAARCGPMIFSRVDFSSRTSGVGDADMMTTIARWLCGTLVCLGLSSTCVAADWVQTWGVAPLPPSQASGPFPATPSFENQTIRQSVRVSVGGEQVRIRFSNEYGNKPLVI